MTLRMVRADQVKAIAGQDSRIQCLRRIGRRGLAGAVLEGALASAAPFVRCYRR